MMSNKLEDLLDILQKEFKKRFDRNIPGSYSKKRPLYKATLDKLTNQVSIDAIGKMILADYDSLVKILRGISEWWEEEFEKYQEVIEDGLERVIEGAKEDVAEERGEDEDPEDIEDDELSPEVLYSWWGEEWHHNIERKHWIAKEIDRIIKTTGGTKRTFNLQDVRYKGLEGAVEDVFVLPYQDEGHDVVEEIHEAIKSITSEENAKKIIAWVFSPSEFEVLNLK